MFFSQGFGSTHMTCGLKVDTRCKVWDRTMGKILKKIKGVSYDLDVEEGMIYISGKVDPQKILRKITKHGKHAVLCWMKTGMNETVHVPNGGIMPMPSLPYGGHLPYHEHGGPYAYIHPFHPPPLTHSMPYSSFPPLLLHPPHYY